MSEQYQDFTYQSPFWFKRWLHRKRFHDALRVLDLQSGQTFLDYGCGDGYLMSMVAQKNSGVSLYGFEPAERFFKEAQNVLSGTGAVLVQDIDRLPIQDFDRVACLETCEHLTQSDLEILLNNVRNRVTPKGLAVFSVPVEIGLPALGKNIFRYLKDRHFSNLTWRNFVRSVFGLRVERAQPQDLNGLRYIYSHIGFDFRNFRFTLGRYFKIVKIVSSPFNILPPGLNNTLYFICQRHDQLQS